MPKDRQNDITKLKVAFSSLAKAPKNLIFISQQAPGISVRKKSTAEQETNHCLF
jgi:hypothetical protein